MKKICVLGSINIDIVTKTARFPNPGETLEGESFATFPGGKGANQAVAAGRLGANVVFLGKVGNDAFGEMALKALREANVDTAYIKKEDISTGTATITVNGEGENTIICVPAANGMVSVEYVKENIEAIYCADILMLQLEIPTETVEWAAQYAADAGKTVILDPAPANPLSEKLLKTCSIITPNETELGVITGKAISGEHDVRMAADALLGKGVLTVIHKCGGRGAYILTARNATLVPGFKVTAVDTTAAGDSFNAGVAVSLANGNSLESSVRYGNAVGAMSVTKIGAQSAMPAAAEVSEFIKERE